MGERRFVVELIKPSHYDDDGYVIQWVRSWIPSNSLACLYAIAQDAASRRALGPDVAIEINAYDECHTAIPIKRIIRRIQAAEGRLDRVFVDALAGDLQPIYNFMNDLPGLQEQFTPFLPIEIVKRYNETLGAFDAGRGCPFQCSFCTIINVQGRKSRWRDADDVERLVRANIAQGVYRFFITDDNFARNRNWEAIFDRLIE